MNKYQVNKDFRFGYNFLETHLRKLPAEAGHEDGTGCNRNFYGEQKEKDNV